MKSSIKVLILFLFIILLFQFTEGGIIEVGKLQIEWDNIIGVNPNNYSWSFNHSASLFENYNDTWENINWSVDLYAAYGSWWVNQTTNLYSDSNYSWFFNHSAHLYDTYDTRWTDTGNSSYLIKNAEETFLGNYTFVNGTFNFTNNSVVLIHGQLVCLDNGTNAYTYNATYDNYATNVSINWSKQNYDAYGTWWINQTEKAFNYSKPMYESVNYSWSFNHSNFIYSNYNSNWLSTYNATYDINESFMCDNWDSLNDTKDISTLADATTNISIGSSMNISQNHFLCLEITCSHFIYYNGSATIIE